ncbi:hypothetical protein NMG60_11029733 [Bertholletia excelsa]
MDPLENNHLQRRSFDFHQRRMHPPPMAPLHLHRRPFNRLRLRFPGSGNDRCRADIGYGLAAKYWGQGITTQAVKMAVGQVFKDFAEIERVQALVDVENRGSQRVLERAGFKREGHLRKYSYLNGNLKDLFVYSFLRIDNISSPGPSSSSF